MGKSIGERRLEGEKVGRTEGKSTKLTADKKVGKKEGGKSRR